MTALHTSPAADGVEFVPPVNVRVLPVPHEFVPPVPSIDAITHKIWSTLAWVRA